MRSENEECTLLGRGVVHFRQQITRFQKNLLFFLSFKPCVYEAAVLVLHTKSYRIKPEIKRCLWMFWRGILMLCAVIQTAETRGKGKVFPVSNVKPCIGIM